MGPSNGFTNLHKENGSFMVWHILEMSPSLQLITGIPKDLASRAA
jgi:hypothetical protein